MFKQSTKVSIHAPTRGATSVIKTKKGGVQCFNPRTHTGCDNFSTKKKLTPYGFNPRTHTGCDVAQGESLKTVDVFQSTHPHGVRPGHSTASYKQIRVSIHAPTRGATRAGAAEILRLDMFQSTHPHGVRLQDTSLFYH